MSERRVVLVVDDDPDIREIVALALEVNGVQCVTARDGLEALAMVRAPNEIGLVLLDLMMPRMCGIEFLEELRRDPGLDQIPVVVISGNYVTEPRVLTLGAREYLRKPLDLDELLRVVARFVPEQAGVGTPAG